MFAPDQLVNVQSKEVSNLSVKEGPQTLGAPSIKKAAVIYRH